VPGAFMSLLNITFLNEAITEKGITEPHLIFNHVRERIIQTISKDGAQDGMDGILICIKENDPIVTYAAANNAPVIAVSSGANDLYCDKMPVGKGENNASFNSFQIELKKGDTLYLLTDGFADQFGGIKGKKFKHKNLIEKIGNIHGQNLTEQHSELKNTFLNWKGDLEQVDDVCIIGIRV
jgi:serine phosphatase RsbU (regulator of sigma subunit)